MNILISKICILYYVSLTFLYIHIRPSWAYLVTWHEARPYFYYYGDPEYGARCEYKNTFQIILATDYRLSFAIYKYVKLEWPNLVIDKNFQTGYSLFHTGYDKKTTTFENKKIDNLVVYSNYLVPGERLVTFNKTECSRDQVN